MLFWITMSLLLATILAARKARKVFYLFAEAGPEEQKTLLPAAKKWATILGLLAITGLLTAGFTVAKLTS